MCLILDDESQVNSESKQLYPILHSLQTINKALQNIFFLLSE